MRDPLKAGSTSTDKTRMERVLVVDDEKEWRFALADALAAKGYETDTAENGRSALKQIEKDPSAYGLLYTDMRMPEVGGLELVEQVSGIDPTIVPVLLSGYITPATTVSAFRAGAHDFLMKPFTSSELDVSLSRAMQRRHMLLGWHQEEMCRMFISSIQAHARSIEAKDAYTAGHCDRVDRYAEIIARRHGGFDEKWIFNLKVASILHDIGKIGIRGAILCKPAALDEHETSEMRSHPAIGGRIVRALYGFNLEPIVRHHHERFDGKGYPTGLKGEMIPLESRMILIADTFDAMTSDRPYRRAVPTAQALEELERHAGTQFDPSLVRIAVEAGEEFEAARREMEEDPQVEFFRWRDPRSKAMADFGMRMSDFGKRLRRK
jgi:putative two-component system response regulator